MRRYSRRHIMQHKSRQTDRQLPVSSSPCRRYEQLRISGICAYIWRKTSDKIGDIAPNMTTPQLNFVTTCASVNIDYRRGCPLYARGDCFFVRNQKITYFSDHRWYWYAYILSRSSTWCHIHDEGDTRKYYRFRGHRSLLLVQYPQFDLRAKRTPFFTREVWPSHQFTVTRSMQPPIRSEISRRVKTWR